MDISSDRMAKSARRMEIQLDISSDRMANSSRRMEIQAGVKYPGLVNPFLDTSFYYLTKEIY